MLPSATHGILWDKGKQEKVSGTKATPPATACGSPNSCEKN